MKTKAQKINENNQKITIDLSIKLNGLTLSNHFEGDVQEMKKVFQMLSEAIKEVK